jgi:hypothetical protein
LDQEYLIGKGMGWQGNGMAREWDGKGMGLMSQKFKYCSVF